ncbi:MAG TPA: hypothetical protein V6C93_26190 [Allocoleopsis sp.]
MRAKFLESLARDCFATATPARKLIFQLRFNPKYHPENGIEGRNNQEIAKLVQKQLQEDVNNRFGTDLQWVVKTLVSEFESQMQQDGVNIEFLTAGDKGKKGKWLVVYDWLWQKHYPHWVLEQQWQELVAKAEKADDWLQVKSVERTLRMPEPRQSTVPLKTEVYLLVNLSWGNRYLLLLYQGTDGMKYCLCPSQGFAPSGELSEQEMYLPQTGAITKSMVFEEVGKEHFLGIVLEKPLELPWLRPNDGEPVPSLNANRLNELLEKLEQQGNLQLFYKSFDVV